ncbi:MAG: site-specific integrase [Bacteriovoracaceae bacterium]|nr:site-specific integrase [Bacteriovoracaceae bacterium]
MSINQFEVKIHKMGSGFYQCKFFDPKTSTRIRKRFPSLKDARVFKKSLETQVLSKGENVFSDLRISQAMQNFIERFPGTKVRKRPSYFKSFIDTFGIYKVVELSQTDLRQWLLDTKSKGDLSDKTLNNIRSQFFGFFQYLIEEDYLTKNPIQGIRFNRNAPPKRSRVVLSIGEVREILENSKTFSSETLYPYLSCVAHTGARKEEITSLHRKDVDFETGLIHLRKTKNGKERFVRISPILEKVLRDHLASHNHHMLFTTFGHDNNSSSDGDLSKLMKKFKEFFPMVKNEWGSHALRHSFAYNFLKKGGKMYQLQAILGHSSINVTVDLYGQLEAQDIECPSPYEP